jgi:hypothetical protein
MQSEKITSDELKERIQEIEIDAVNFNKTPDGLKEGESQFNGKSQASCHFFQKTFGFLRKIFS